MRNTTETVEIISDFVEGLYEDKRFCSVKSGVYYAPKAFAIIAILNWCNRERIANRITRAEVIRNFKLINKFLDDQLELKWKDGKFITVNQSVA